MDKYSNHYHIGEHATEDINPLIYDEDYYLVSEADKVIAELEAENELLKESHTFCLSAAKKIAELEDNQNWKKNFFILNKEKTELQEQCITWELMCDSKDTQIAELEEKLKFHKMY